MTFVIAGPGRERLASLRRVEDDRQFRPAFSDRLPEVESRAVRQIPGDHAVDTARPDPVERGRERLGRDHLDGVVGQTPRDRRPCPGVAVGVHDSNRVRPVHWCSIGLGDVVVCGGSGTKTVENRNRLDALGRGAVPVDARRLVTVLRPEGPFGRDHDVHRHVVGGGLDAAREDLPLVDRRRDGRLVVEQSRLQQDGVLQVAVPLAFADSVAGFGDRDAPRDHEADGCHVLGNDLPSEFVGAADGRRAVEVVPAAAATKGRGPRGIGFPTDTAGGDGYKRAPPDTPAMDRTAFVDAVRDEEKTELSRLGSSKSLYADTEGEMEPEAVLAAAADEAHHAAETLAGWTDNDVDGTLAAAADRERDHYDAIAGELDAHDPGDPSAAVGVLGEQGTATDRLGALVGWTLVADGKSGQCTGFFTGQADPQTAGLFRGFGEDYEATREDALDALESVCESDEDWERAMTAATGVVEAAYEEYFETLESLGVNPKPVC